jgi:fumarate reductase subunit D
LVQQATQQKSATGPRLLITGISAAAGVCFAALAALALSASAYPVRRFHWFSIVIAVAAVLLGLLAFRTAISARADAEEALASVARGVIGAMVGLVIIAAFLFMFGADTRSFLAHALGKPTSSFTTFRLLLGCSILGFATAFVAFAARLRR